MENYAQITKSISLEKYGIKDAAEVIYNPSFDFLYQEELKSTLEGFEKGNAAKIRSNNKPAL